jgi:hypothetical protein
MNHEDSLVWSSIVFFLGSLVTLFGIDLHSIYAYRQTYETATHLHLGAGLVILAGLTMIIVGLLGIITTLISRDK